MFKQNFIRLCNEKGVAPTTVCTAVGLSNAAYSCWTDESVPRKATLMRIADYFGVTVDTLLAEPPLTPVEEAMARLTAGVKAAVDATDKKKKPVLGLNPKLSALIDIMNKDELEDLERYAEFILSKKKN